MLRLCPISQGGKADELVHPLAEQLAGKVASIPPPALIPSTTPHGAKAARDGVVEIS